MLARLEQCCCYWSQSVGLGSAAVPVIRQFAHFIWQISASRTRSTTHLHSYNHRTVKFNKNVIRASGRRAGAWDLSERGKCVPNVTVVRRSWCDLFECVCRFFGKMATSSGGKCVIIKTGHKKKIKWWKYNNWKNQILNEWKYKTKFGVLS